tara:strand:+ start:280 stop:1512 length:1233 start_codon:yes stop_codon:yes gene_type:complete
MKKDKQHSDTWCPIPFVAVSYHPMGALTRCMMSEELMSYDLDWDNQSFQDLRKSMLNGKWDLPGCNSCKSKEDFNITSQRERWLFGKTRNRLSEDAYDNPGLINNTVRHLFLNFNNVCNFKCRMCSPKYSNSLIPEQNFIEKKYPEVGKRIIDEEHKKQIKNINDVEQFLEINKHKLKNVTQIWITGGEPFIGKTLYNVKDMLYKYANPEKIFLTITTNGSKVDVNRLQEFDRFKMLHLDISLDVVGNMFEYMRSDGLFTWYQMDTFIDKVSKFGFGNSKWFKFSCNSSYQMYNATKMKELYEYNHNLEKEYDSKILTNQRVLIGPAYFQARHLPEEIKTVANEKIEKLLEHQWLDQDDVQNIKDCQEMLNKKSVEEEWERFKTMTRIQDEYRKTHLNKYDNLLSDYVYN